MAGGIFKSSKSALVFMGMTLGSVALLVGTEEDSGALVIAADEISRDTSGFRDTPADRFASPPSSRPAPRRALRRDAAPQEETFFASDEDLIDDTVGFDPTPEPIVPFDDTVGYNQATVVESYGQIEQF